jgi:DNA (cytosine-5)-methyltransferase 1
MRVGSLCTGYGGLEIAVRNVFAEAELAFVADTDPFCEAILAHRFPHVENLGDITAICYDEVEPIDLLAAGFPCQDVSVAGGREGLMKGNRTGLWAEVARAIDELRPPLVFLENVHGLRSAKAGSPVELCPVCMGDPEAEPFLRALGAVQGDLAALGYASVWDSVRASDIGAPHKRERVFVLAYPDGNFERASSLEARGGLVASEQGYQEPGRRGDWEYALASYSGGEGLHGRAR